jgi:hypothetical protein
MIVNKLNITVIALSLGFAFSAGALAEGMSQDDYKAGKDSIATAYNSAKADCASLSGNPGDICVAEAKGKEMIARAELEASYKPNRETYYQARIAKAEAEYALAKERCDDKAGNAKDVCVKEAKAAETAAKADAKAQVKISDANDTANAKSAAARSEANNQATGARKDAAADKLEAQYGVAKEKCDVYAGGAKDVCLDRAKERFGKS